MPDVSVPEWAKLQGISKVAAYKRIKTGKVTRLANGLIDVEKANAEWAANRNEREAVKNPSGVAAPKSEQPAGAPDERSRGEAQRRREWLQLEQDELDHRRRLGELVEVGPLNAWASGMIIRARDVLMRIGPECRDRLAQEPDPIKCQEIVESEIVRALKCLSQYRAPHAA